MPSKTPKKHPVKPVKHVKPVKPEKPVKMRAKDIKQPIKKFKQDSKQTFKDSEQPLEAPEELVEYCEQPCEGSEQHCEDSKQPLEDSEQPFGEPCKDSEEPFNDFQEPLVELSEDTPNKGTKRKRKPRGTSVKIPDDTEVQCYYCGTILLQGDLVDHQFKFHGRCTPVMSGPPRPFQCPICKHCLKRNPNKFGHVCPDPDKVPNKTADSARLQCQYCPRILAGTTCMKGHLKQAHNRQSSDFVVTDIEVTSVECRCEKCDTEFVTSQTLNEHLANCLEGSIFSKTIFYFKNYKVIFGTFF